MATTRTWATSNPEGTVRETAPCGRSLTGLRISYPREGRGEHGGRLSRHGGLRAVERYLTVKSTTKIWPADTREAYAFWKVNGTYYGVSSAQTGWAPNQAAYFRLHRLARRAVEQHLAALGNGTSTWSSQPTYVMPIVGSQTTTYIYAGDIWNSNNRSLSTYLWLPFIFDGTAWHLSYSAQWSINFATGVVSTH